MRILTILAVSALLALLVLGAAGCDPARMRGSRPVSRPEAYASSIEAGYECAGKHLFLVQERGRPALLVTTPRTHLHPYVPPHLMENHWRDEAGDHYLSWDDSDPIFAIEYVFPADRKLDAEYQRYTAAAGPSPAEPRSFVIDEHPGGLRRVSGTPSARMPCWARPERPVTTAVSRP